MWDRSVSPYMHCPMTSLTPPGPFLTLLQPRWPLLLYRHLRMLFGLYMDSSFHQGSCSLPYFHGWFFTSWTLYSKVIHAFPEHLLKTDTPFHAPGLTSSLPCLVFIHTIGHHLAYFKKNVSVSFPLDYKLREEGIFFLLFSTSSLVPRIGLD